MTQEPNPVEVLSGLAGRQLLTPTELLRELARANWPDDVLLHPADFLALLNVFMISKDDDGLYFQIANAKVRPNGSGGTLDLTEYEGPGRVVLARPVPEKWHS